MGKRRSSGGWRERLRATRRSLLWEALARQKGWVWAALLLQVGSLVFNVVLSFMTITMINKGIVDQISPLNPFYRNILLMYAVTFCFGYSSGLVAARIGYELEFDIRTRLYDAIQAGDLRELDAAAGGQLVTRSLTDLQLVQQVLTQMLPLVPQIPLIVAVLIILLVLSPPLAIATAAALPINLWLLRKFQKKLWGLSWAELNERAEVARAIDEPVRGIRVVKAFGSEDSERDHVGRVALRTYRFSMTRVRLLARYDLPLTFVPMVIQALVLLIGARLAINGHLSLGLFLLAFQGIGFVTQLATYINVIASFVQYVRTAQGRLGEVVRIPKAQGREPIDPLPTPVGAGELVVMTCPQGSEKPAVVSVPTLGIRVITEEPFLFAATLRENLELGADAPIDEAVLRKAIWAAGAEELLAGVDDDLDSTIGDRGLTLSGGQRQRLALARALVDPPRVLVLDDALAAVNPSLEVEILGRMRAHAPATGILYLTRRPSLAAVADRAVAVPAATPVDVVPSELPDLLSESALSGAGPADANLAEVVSGLKLSDEVPKVPEAALTDSRRPRMREALRPFRALIAAGLVVLFIQTAAKLTPTLLFGSVSDLVHDGKASATDERAYVFMGVAAILALCAFGYRILNQRFTQGLVYTLRRRVFHRLSRLGIDFYDRELPGAVAARVVNDLDVLINFLSEPAFRLLTEIALFVGGMTVIILYSPPVAPVVLVMTVLILTMSFGQLPISNRAFSRARDQLGRVTAKFEEDFAGRQDIRTFAAESAQSRKFVEASQELRRARRWALGITVTYGESLSFVTQVGALTVLFVAGNRVLAGALSIGSALALRMMSTTATNGLGQIGPWYAQLLDLRVSWRRLGEPFEAPILPIERTDAQRCERLRGEVTFDHVDFAYPHVGRPVLHDVSFTIPAGGVAALVGVTGAGKSSIAKLLTRMYDPTDGAVIIDGHDVRDLDLRTYRSRLGIVPQDAFLFRGTVASNIAYGRPDASRADIEAAARAVGADAVLSSLAGGYDHPVEEEGRNLSAAQRQLVAVARAWLTRPDVLVLDEATAALDPALERRVLDAVAQLRCTALMVTHRHDAVGAADLVIMLDAGRVIATGPPSELDGAGGAFDRLWTSETADIAR